ncbi:hypothetical protein SUGI_0765500 [Cryptomeria japonica]|uniref:mediator of RNA polymerase II transcription subunit 32 n=1 Tax=Cryptomeria japonica TaxID=3369 RepID=UPI0024148EEF|nr:mediator of RNA polymerase II transcription subunit 32 [Cryptomeria japonica]XP_057829277.1 mediator of RNA polymerase II transcription subunit 32 [Cryptomeria japonica]XP_057829278.1 mediator of RNA polymerase II transcription subunit 32 [Cryptomeria japonica]GLJ37678.1 hypothetical protein SUGI_0765500 [Cryptomeria japonica]
MEKLVESLEKAYQSLVASAAYVFESNELAKGAKSASTDAALETFKQHWELFKVSCDQAEEFIESVRQRIGSECLVDEATGTLAHTNVGIPPISAVRLEAMSKAVRLLVIELQHGSASPNSNSFSSHTLPPPASAFDARFGDDSGH